MNKETVKTNSKKKVEKPIIKRHYKVMDKNSKDVFRRFTKDELIDIISANCKFFDITQISHHLMIPNVYLNAMTRKNTYKRSREQYEAFANWLIYVPPVKKPRSFNDYREVLQTLNRCIKMRSLCEYYGFNFSRYVNFMKGDNYSMTKEELDLLIKALKLRPLDKIE